MPSPVSGTQPPLERREAALALLALLAVQFCFGMFPVFSTWAFEAFTPRAVAFWRVAAGALALGLVALAWHRGDALPRRADLPLLVACSLLGVTLNQVFFLEGLSRSSAVHAGMIMCLIPVFTYGVALLLRRERWRWLRVLGIALALSATAWLLLHEGGPLGQRTLGDALMVTNAFFYSVYLVLSKPLLQRLPPAALAAWVYVFALPVLPWLGSGEALSPPIEGHELAWRGLVLALVFPTTLAYLLNAFALARVNASTTAVFVYLQPVVTALGAWWLLDQPLSREALAVAPVLFLAVWMVMQRRF